jgi:hypothetical protein
VRLQWIGKWDWKLPTTVLGDDTSSLIQVQ